MGIPIMIVQPDGEAAQIIRDAGAGEWIPPENPVALKDALIRWVENTELVAGYASASARAASANSRDRLAIEMLDVFRAVIS